MIVASTQGILVADMSLAAGTHQIDQKGHGLATSNTVTNGLEQKGVMLLSDSSSPAALTSAFVARGAVKSFAARTNFNRTFRRIGLTSFPTIDGSNGVDFGYAWEGYEGTSFPALNFASATSLSNAWLTSYSLTSVPAIQAPVCTNFSTAFRSCTSLATIDPNANFGESASGVNFSLAFYLSGLTSLPDNLDMSQGDVFTSVFQSTPITSIGTGVLLGTAAASPTVNFASAFQSCASLAALPDNLDLSQGSVFNDAFYGCTSLATIGTGVLLGTAASGVNFTSAFQASGLTALPADLDMSKGSSFQNTFLGCGSLATIGTGVLLGTASSSVNFNQAFRTSGLTELPAGLDLSKGSSFSNTFRECASLATIGTGVLLGTASSSVDFTEAFRDTGLTALPAGLDLSKGSSFILAFQDCGSLVTIGNGVLLGTALNSVDFSSAFRDCTNLVTLPANLNLSKGDDFNSMFFNCSSLVTFPAGAFDTMGTPLAYCFLNAWNGCTSLSGASVDAILDSIDTSGQSAPGTGPSITITYDTGTTAPAYTAIASLKGKGWVVIVNGTTL